MFEGADAPVRPRGAATGAGRGIGRAIAQRLAALGATVLCVSRTQSELDETVRSAGSRAFALALDISADDAAQATVGALQARVPSLDLEATNVFIRPMQIFPLRSDTELFGERLRHMADQIMDVRQMADIARTILNGLELEGRIGKPDRFRLFRHSSPTFPSEGTN
jgi:NAD(P)-dependent dehydrogenase (short-subunit alcohol dehydrogenase family)